ncbi:MAG: hypothetical protein CBC38_07305 [Gammaproteobacteria bacterium TMED78]|nr:MAG: hypothetical protein CBC38_07305 [Gammaproteobacteria bacterium TMED78]|tara:strand:- start:25300 stop:25659 length:360 start_codon:yes stop_codon:yes gene_type:complete
MTNQEMPEINIESDNLYEQATYTDRKMGSILKLIPVHKDGSRDDSRKIIFIGQTQLLTPAGALPINFQIPDNSLESSVEQFGQYANKALEEAMKKLEEMRKESESSIIVPNSGEGAPRN